MAAGVGLAGGMVSVSNSLSGRHWELDQVPAVGDLTDIVQLGTGRAAGVPTRFLRDCRRTAARTLIRASVPERVAILLTGHKTRAILDRYNIINEQELLEAGDQLVASLAQHAPATPRGRRPHTATGGASGPNRSRSPVMGPDVGLRGARRRPHGGHRTGSVGQTSGATPRGLNPGSSEEIGNSRRTGGGLLFT